MTFSANGTNGAKNTTATFTKAGTYSVQVTIKDLGNLTVTSSLNVAVTQTLTSITVAPASASVSSGATQQFTASAKDQFGTALATQPGVSWTVSGGGTITSSGLFTAGSTAGGPYTITASSGGKSGTATVTVTVTAGGGILGNNIVGTSADPSGGNDLNCWRFQASSSFTANAMQINLAREMTGKMKLAIYSDNNGTPGTLLVGSTEMTNPAAGWVTFTLTGGQPITAGTYYWLAAWSNGSYISRSQSTGGTARYLTKTYGAWPTPLTGTRGPYTTKVSVFAYGGGINVPVTQTSTSITVAPASASVSSGATQQFTASAKDQFGTALATQPGVSWTVSGGGTITSSGLFTAGSTAGGPYTITASSGGKSGTATVTVTVTAGGGILGNNIVGTSADPSGGNDLNCWRFQASSSFTANAMQINLAREMTGNMKLAIYSDNNGTPGTLLVGSTEMTNPAAGWVTFTLTGGQPITAGTYYWLAAWSNGSYTPRTEATGGTARYLTKTYGAWPTLLTGTIGPYTTKDSIFAY